MEPAGDEMRERCLFFFKIIVNENKSTKFIQLYKSYL